MSTFDDPYVFLAAARTGSMSQAAKLLSVEQSTVSRRIKALEDAIGGALFHRSSRGLVLTDLGQALLPDLEAAEHHLLRAHTLAKGHTQEISGLVRITTTPSLAAWFIAPALKTWSERWPLLRFSLSASTHLLDLGRAEADIALRFMRPKHGDLTVQRVANLRQVVVGHRAYLEALETSPDPRSLPWLTLDLSPLPTPELRWFVQHIGVTPVLATNDFVALTEALRSGLGVALVSEGVMRLDPNLRELPLELPEAPSLPLWLVTHRALRKVPRVAVVWDALSALCMEFG